MARLVVVRLNNGRCFRISGVLAASINERRAEIASVMNNKKVEITGIQSVNEKFAPNYPREYETWTQTMDTSFQSKYDGNQMVDALELARNGYSLGRICFF